MATEAQPPVDTAVALTPNNIEALFGLVKEIAADVDALASHGHVDRQALIIKCRSMVQALETPRETMVKHCWAQVSIQHCIPKKNRLQNIWTDGQDWCNCGSQLRC